MELFSSNYRSEGFDVARVALSKHFKNPHLEKTIAQIEHICGGKLSDLEFTPGGCDEYKTLLNDLDNDNS